MPQVPRYLREVRPQGVALVTRCHWLGLAALRQRGLA